MPPILINRTTTFHIKPKTIYINVCLYALLIFTGNRNRNKSVNKGNNKITELRTILQRESQNS